MHCRFHCCCICLVLAHVVCIVSGTTAGQMGRGRGVKYVLVQEDVGSGSTRWRILWQCVVKKWIGRDGSRFNARSSWYGLWSCSLQQLSFLWSSRFFWISEFFRELFWNFMVQDRWSNPYLWTLTPPHGPKIARADFAPKPPLASEDFAPVPLRNLHKDLPYVDSFLIVLPCGTLTNFQAREIWISVLNQNRGICTRGVARNLLKDLPYGIPISSCFALCAKFAGSEKLNFGAN